MTTTPVQSQRGEVSARQAVVDKPTLCFFHSPRSGPSRRAEAFLANVLQRRKNHRKIVVRRINCDDRPDLAERYAVEKLPTLIVIDRHRVRARLEGARNCREIEQLLEPWLGMRTHRESERLPVREAAVQIDTHGSGNGG